MVRYLVELDMPYDRRKVFQNSRAKEDYICIEGCSGSKPWQKKIIIFGDAKEVCVILVGWWRRRRVVKASFEKLRRGVVDGGGVERICRMGVEVRKHESAAERDSDSG
jgi:hypothetical protein